MRRDHMALPWTATLTLTLIAFFDDDLLLEVVNLLAKVLILLLQLLNLTDQVFHKLIFFVWGKSLLVLNALSILQRRFNFTYHIYLLFFLFYCLRMTTVVGCHCS